MLEGSSTLRSHDSYRTPCWLACQRILSSAQAIETTEAKRGSRIVTASMVPFVAILVCAVLFLIAKATATLNTSSYSRV